MGSTHPGTRPRSTQECFACRCSSPSPLSEPLSWACPRYLGWGSQLSISFARGAYALSNDTLCYGVAFCFSFCAFLYSLWMIPWSQRAGVWHLALSLLSVALFVTASVRMQQAGVDTQGSPPAVAWMLAFVLSPLLFLLVQAAFVLDGVLRAWGVFLRR